MPKTFSNGVVSNAGLAAEAAGPGAGRMTVAEYLAPPVEATPPAGPEETEGGDTSSPPDPGTDSPPSKPKRRTGATTNAAGSPRRAHNAGNR